MYRTLYGPVARWIWLLARVPLENMINSYVDFDMMNRYELENLWGIRAIE